jgi:hypothetical protein
MVLIIVIDVFDPNSNKKAAAQICTTAYGWMAGNSALLPTAQMGCEEDKENNNCGNHPPIEGKLQDANGVERDCCCAV